MPWSLIIALLVASSIAFCELNVGEIQKPRYFTVSFGINSIASVRHSLSVPSVVMYSHLAWLIARPAFAKPSFARSYINFSSSWDFAISTVSSAKACPDIFIFSFPYWYPSSFTSISLRIWLIVIAKRSGDNGHPCRTPRVICTGTVFP